MNDGVDFFSEMAEYEFAVAVAFSCEYGIDDDIHFAAAVSDGLAMIVADDMIVGHLFNIVSKHDGKNANLTCSNEKL